nr:hypothetical protein [Tanacetum cinerariifolium]
VGSASIGSSISTGCTPLVSASSTPPMSPPPVSAGRPTGSAGRHVSAGGPSGSANRTPVLAGRILGMFTAKPTTVAQALEDPNWEEAMQAEMQQFRNQKARLVAQGHRQEKRIDYSDVFAPIARIEAIRLFLAFASFMGFRVYQMDVKSAFLYEKIVEE